MKNKLLFISLLSIAIAGGMQSAGGSSLLQAELGKICFETIDGNTVVVSSKDHKVIDIEVSINGHKIDIPKTAYEDLLEPHLSDTVLLWSVGNDASSAYQLEFPLEDPTKNYESFDEMKIVSFLIVSNKLVERDIFDNKKTRKLLSSIKF